MAMRKKGRIILFVLSTLAALGVWHLWNTHGGKQFYVQGKAKYNKIADTIKGE